MDTIQSHTLLRALREQPVPALTSAGAVLDLVVEKLGDDDQVCDEVEDACNHLVEERRVETQNCQRSLKTLEGCLFI